MSKGFFFILDYFGFLEIAVGMVFIFVQLKNQQ